jgi:hypothetical protein
MRNMLTRQLDRSTTYTVVLPQLPDDTLTFTARLGKDRLLDARGDPSRQYPIAAADSIRFGGVTQGGEGLDGTLPDGVAGFYGLGINVCLYHLLTSPRASRAMVTRKKAKARGRGAVLEEAGEVKRAK